MKKIIVLILLICAENVKAQSGLQIGAEISPSWKLLLHKSKTTSIRSSESGFGFTAGIPVKYWLSEYTSFNTGLNYIFSSYDVIANNVFISTTRFNTVQIPLSFNINLKADWYGIVGTGVDYNFISRTRFGGIRSDISPIINKVQPFLTLGVNNLRETDNGFFEIGLQARYQLLNLNNSNSIVFDNTSSHVLSLDVLMRFYI
ncbi:outer membrane beta-barrel protein [Crocinitomix catalasitica]|uniref:outer membrane beta-barrel protein n=1 Tax=Crocinitomix catalasitica TaxID=184607 RepID=UPI0004808162|nr:outer membrane beta-barrel protein [Crocinitomix catalasitica]